MTKRPDNRRAPCRCLPHVESLESRQLLSGIPLPAYPPGKPLALVPAVDRSVSAGMLPHAFRPATDAAGENPTTVSVLLGNGDGSFQTARPFTMPMHGGPAVVADFNHDGIPDLAVANDEGGSVRVLLGNGDGSFQTPRTVAVGSHLRLEVGDFNRDGIDDLAIAGRSRPSAAPHGHRLATLGVSPPALVPGETRRTQKGHAISLANYWFDVTDALRTAAKVADVEARTEAPPAGLPLRPEDEPAGGIPRPLAPFSEEVAATSGPAGPQPCEADCRETEAALPAPVGRLLAGLVSVDLPALERKVDAFFREVDNLAEEAAEALAGGRLTPWLVVGAATGAAYVLARRRLRARTGTAGMPAGGDPRSWEWSWLSRGAVPAPWEES